MEPNETPGPVEPDQNSPIPPPPVALPESLRGLGQGELPAKMKRFAWGAFLLTPLWGIVYGLIPVIRWWLIAQLVPIVIALFTSWVKSTSGMAAVSVVSLILTSMIQLWIGMNANSWLWRKERIRLELFAGAQPRLSVGQFLDKQRTWTIAGMVLVGVSTAGLVVGGLSADPEFVTMRNDLGLTTFDIGLSGVWMAAELLLASWLAYQMRKESPASPDVPAEGDSGR